MKHKCTKCGHVDEIAATNQVKGGKARWKGTTKKTRSAAASKAAKARWQKSENTDYPEHLSGDYPQNQKP